MNIIIQGQSTKSKGYYKGHTKRYAPMLYTGLYQKICIGQTRYKPCSTTT